jgi:hypothetical protein
MNKLVGTVALFLALLLLSSPFAAGQKKAGKAKEEAATKDDYKTLEGVKELEGSLTSLDPATKVMTLKVAYQYLEPNPKYKPNNRASSIYTRQLNYLMLQQQQAMNLPNPVLRMQRLQQIVAQAQALPLQGPPGASPYRVATAYKDFDAEAIDDVVVRRLKLPMEYDDKGNVKEYTEKEKKELRGNDPKKPGYAATWDDVQLGQKVKLYLTTKKKTAAKAKADKAKKDLAQEDKEAAGDGDKDAPKDGAEKKDKAAAKKAKADDPTDEPRALVRMILIQAEPDPASLPKEKARKKKKD